ncbi:MAG: type I-U CRISPR-associated RAMP protein Csb1/Cas7u [Verrucomicrobia bacterium]|nr:type I-U CRISPR-associated RAMP protein Csb1/Cas7u [Verrucomicrobiota bacterium]
MSIDYTALNDQPRLLLEATLKPLQGERFQATGFADLGAALYKLPDGTQKLLVESAQSVANRLEMAIWDEANDDLIEGLKGLPFVRIDCGRLGRTTTIQEFHRLNSPYLWKGDDNEAATKFRRAFCDKVGISVPKSKKKSNNTSSEGAKGVLNRKQLTDAIFWFDPCCLIHGVFLEKLDGRLRVTRALSGFIEATNVLPAESGGTKVDHVLPSPKTMGLNADEGFGNVPFHRTEFVAECITVYFNLDLALIHSYGLPECAERLLISISLLKVQRFLELDLRLRAACDLQVSGDVIVKRPAGFILPTTDQCMRECQNQIRECLENRYFCHDVTTTEFRQKTKDMKISVIDIQTNPTISEERKGDKLLTWNERKKEITIKAKLIEEIGIGEIGEVLGAELYPDNSDAQERFVLIVEKVMTQSEDENSSTEEGV